MLSAGQVITSKKFNDINVSGSQYMTEILQKYYNEKFKDGVCNHGEAYFAGTGYTYLNPCFELLLEKNRIAINSNLPSRANCIFAIDDIRNIPQLIKLLKLNPHEVEIWEVECEKSFKADMYILDVAQKMFLLGESMLITSLLIDYYWQGKKLKDFNPNEITFWEYLLEPPVKVISKVMI